MAGRCWPHMVGVVPALAKGENGDEPVVGRQIAVSYGRLPYIWASELTNHVVCRQLDDYPSKNAPDDHLPSTDRKEDKRRDDDGARKSTVRSADGRGPLTDRARTFSSSLRRDPELGPKRPSRSAPTKTPVGSSADPGRYP